MSLFYRLIISIILLQSVQCCSLNRKKYIKQKKISPNTYQFKLLRDEPGNCNASYIVVWHNNKHEPDLFVLITLQQHGSRLILSNFPDTDRDWQREYMCVIFADVLLKHTDGCIFTGSTGGEDSTQPGLSQCKSKLEGMSQKRLL